MRQKNEAAFRFFVLRMADLKNAKMIAEPPEPQDLKPRGGYGKEYNDKLKRHKAALAAASKAIPNLPPCYLEKNDGLITHLDVRKFKEAWDRELKEDPLVAESRTKGVKYPTAAKHALRRGLADFCVKNGIALSLP